MAKKRLNVNEIAEVLIDKFDEMEQTAVRIEKVAKTPLNVNSEPINLLIRECRDLVSKQNSEEREILRKIENLQSKNLTRLPNWILGILFAFFLGFIGSIFFAYSSVKKVKFLERQNEYFMQKLDAFEKAEK
jgi:cbb3-type cytochrome oxidase subunit 3